jgi:putative ABC transport system substrate-binding protein
MQFDRLRRREFVTLLGGVATWPLAARAQQSGTMRRIGFLGPTQRTNATSMNYRVCHELFRDYGSIEGATVSIDYRWAEGRSDRLAELAAELVQRKASVIVTAGPNRPSP